MHGLPHKLDEWRAAGLIDDATRASILAFETSQQTPERWTWQVRLATVLGAVLLAAGILLFIAAHWDRLSPAARVVVVLAVLIGLHVGGAAAASRHPVLSTSLHAVGTVAAGGAVALLGQIFNMNEHWPAAILLWALCAGAGALLLRDSFQRTLALLLLPLWLGCEWADRTAHQAGAEVYLARFVLLVGCTYLAAFLGHRQRGLFRALFTCGAVLLPAGVSMLTQGWLFWSYRTLQPLPTGAKLLAWAVLLGVAAAAVALRRTAVEPVCTGLLLGLLLPWLVTTTRHSEPSLVGTQSWTETHPGIFFYLLLAVASVALIHAGLRQHAPALVNYGTLAFGATVFWFYFADLWDKLGRSAGLLLMGVLFLLGGWQLERMRRRLLLTMETAA